MYSAVRSEERRVGREEGMGREERDCGVEGGGSLSLSLSLSLLFVEFEWEGRIKVWVKCESISVQSDEREL